MAGYFPSSLKSDLPDYSTSEVKTGQKWIDGKDIYMRTFENNTTFSGTTPHDAYVAASLISDIDKIVDMETILTIHDSGSNTDNDMYGNCVVIDPYVSGNYPRSFIRTSYDASNGINLYGMVGSNLSITKSIHTAYYTKQ